jgi:hypothetical protein
MQINKTSWLARANARLELHMSSYLLLGTNIFYFANNFNEVYFITTYLSTNIEFMM